MSTTPLNAAGYQAISAHPPHSSVSPASTRSIPTAAKYALTILGSIAFTVILLFGLSSVSSSHASRLVIPRLIGRIITLPDKPATGDAVHWTGINGADGQTYEARSPCGPLSYTARCECSPISTGSGAPCAEVLYAAPYSDFLSREEGCFCFFEGHGECKNADFVMHVDCVTWG